MIIQVLMVRHRDRARSRDWDFMKDVCFGTCNLNYCLVVDLELVLNGLRLYFNWLQLKF